MKQTKIGVIGLGYVGLPLARLFSTKFETVLEVADELLQDAIRRINPGDKLHTVEKIKKVTSGSTPEIADYVDAVYNSVLVNGTHMKPNGVIYDVKGTLPRDIVDGRL